MENKNKKHVQKWCVRMTRSIKDLVDVFWIS